jgi:hypothetical protein
VRNTVLIFCIVLLSAFILPLWGEPVFVEPYGYYLDIPEGWEILDISDLAKVSFTDPDHIAVFQIFVTDSGNYDGAEALYADAAGNLGATGDKAAFDYSGRDALLADLSFKAGSFDARGYGVFIDGFTYDFVLLAFAPLAYYERMHDLILSSIDSFAPTEAEKYIPGPISQFFYPFPGKEFTSHQFDFRGTAFQFHSDDGALDASQVLIEREARILGKYKENMGPAWKRYYRMIYKDNFTRVKGLSWSLDNYFAEEGVPRDLVPVLLLEWLQDFSYSRTGSFSDLLGPGSCIIEETGDCDSLGLLYVMLLHHLGHDAVLFVSSRYSHALGGVAIDLPGATMEVNGKSYLVAELTEKVDIGMIAQEMADPDGWIAIEMRE